MSDKKTVVDAYQWSYDRYVKNDQALVKFSRDAREKADLARQIYDIREKLRMTREDLAEFSGLTAETIEDLEESDYDGDWDEAIQRVNTGFHGWFTNVILPVARMRPEELSVGIAG